MRLPSPRRRSVATILLFFSCIYSSSASAIDPVCDAIKKLGGGSSPCKALISVPTLAPKMCTVTLFKVDSCKTKFKGSYPCGVSWKGVKMCDGWTCVPGTVPVETKVLCGANIGSQKVNLCDMIKNIIPVELLRQSAGYCKCLPKVFDFIDLDTVKSLVGSMDLGQASADLLQKYGEAQKCMIDNGFNVQENKKDLLAVGGVLAQTDSVKIFTASEIDLTRYIQFAGAISPCFVGSCSVEAIKGFFEDYLTDSEKTMADQLKGFLAPWQKAFDGIKSGFEGIGSDIDQIKNNFGTVTDSVDKIASDFCNDISNCAETTVSKLKKKVEDTVTTSKALIGIQNDITTAVSDAQQLYKIVSDAITAFDTLSDLGIDEIVKKVFNGQLRSIKEVAETLQAAKKLPDIISELQRTLPDVQKNIATLEKIGPDFTNNVQDIMATSWLSDAKGDAAAANNAVTAIQQIQSLFKDNIVSHATNIASGVSFMATSLDAITISGAPNLQVGVASYQRWSKGNFDMACLTTGKIPMKLGTFKVDVDYPKFYRCNQKYTIPFPNQHIPYVKIEFSKNAGFAAASANTAVVVQSISSSVEVEAPTATDNTWPYITEVPESDPMPSTAPLDNYDPNASEIVLPSSAYMNPSDLYSNSADVPSMTAPPSSVVFFATTDANGAEITSDTTLTDGSSLSVTATEVHSGTSTASNSNITTPAGFESQQVSAVSATATASTKSTTSSGSATTAAKLSSSGGSVTICSGFWLPVLAAFIWTVL